MAEIPEPRDAYAQVRSLPWGERRQLQLWLAYPQPHPDPERAALLAGLARWQQRTTIIGAAIATVGIVALTVLQVASGQGPGRAGWSPWIGVITAVGVGLGLMNHRTRRAEKINAAAASRGGPPRAAPKLAWYDTLHPAWMLWPAVLLGGMGMILLLNRPTLVGGVALAMGLAGLARFVQGILGRRRGGRRHA